MPLTSVIQFLAASRPPCACAEFTRVSIGPFSLPVGILTVVFGLVLLLLLPAIAWGAVLRRREARAMADVLGRARPTDLAGRRTLEPAARPS